MDKPILLLDMDSVIVDLMTEWHRRYNEDYNDNLSVEKLASWESELYVKPECGTKIYDYLDQPGLFANLPPVPGAIECLYRMRDDYELIIVTSSRTYAYTEKEQWVERHLPFIGKRNLIFAHRKELIRGDLLFDDAPHNLEDFAATGRLAIAMDYPYNRNVNVPRVNNWEQFERLVPVVLNMTGRRSP
ncbi:5'(3')-deoxyribonucleotidase [Paenibacillus thermoaerophilus]|uniref:5'(3')-deoxyribonucleotidase n=1 Tax=Paenibacillus thermoaerophilus TaxID=1215385 RepID=A0ABW2V7M0_9BACL|nr:5'(3')-deoxyribonucleotidase [Paenibacillus thermoaerophilus]